MPPKVGKPKKQSGKSKKSKKEDVVPEVVVPEKVEVEEFTPILSGPDISPFDQVIANADLVVKSLLKDEKYIVATQVTKLIDYSHMLKEETEQKQKDYDELLPKIEEANNSAKEALQVSLASEKTIDELQIELEDAWREIDASHLREQSLQEQLSGIQGKVAQLEGKVKKIPKSDSMGEAAELGPLGDKKETILRERDRLQAEVEELEKRLHMQRLYSENVEKLRIDTEAANQALMEELESSDTNKTKFKRTIQDLFMNLEKCREENSISTKKISSLESRVEELQKQLHKKSQELQITRFQLDKIKQEQSSWNNTLLKRSTALNTCTQEKNSLSEQLRATINKLKAKEYELTEIKADCKKSIANYDILAARLAKMGNMRGALGKDISILKNEIANLQKECLQYAKTVENERKEKDMVIHERDSLRNLMTRLSNIRKDLEHAILLKNSTVERCQDDILKKTQQIDEMRHRVDHANRERDRNAQEIESLQTKIEGLQEGVTLKAEQISTMKIEMAEKQSLYIKLKQNLETTNSERILLRQQLQACTEEKDRVKAQYTHVSYQVTQLKEEIDNKQKHILTLSLETENLIKEKQELKIEIRNQASLLNKIRGELKDTKKENEKLYKSLSDDERRLMKQAIKLDHTVHEKDLIGSQMIRRNNEIVLLKEQNAVLETALQRGQMQYNLRIEDIKLLKQELMQARSRRNILTRGLANTADMRLEVLSLHRLLLKARITNTALKEEAVSPINIHRWRPLGGKDPDRMELIWKIIELQKRVIRLQTQASKREKELQQSHRLYMLLKEFIEKLPSYKVKEDLLESQRVIRVRSRKLKALTAELNIKELEIKARDCTINDLQDRLNHTIEKVDQLKQTELVETEKPRGKASDFASNVARKLESKVHCL